MSIFDLFTTLKFPVSELEGLEVIVSGHCGLLIVKRAVLVRLYS
jgi:hypothetical protein